jgi:hypothetical protein
MAVMATLDGSQARDRLNLIVHQREIGIQVAPVDRVNAPAGQLDILLRHRPASISQCQESA